MKTSQEKTMQVADILVNYKIAGQGPVILILHGWGSSSGSWIEIQNNLAEKGHQVIVPDLPGFGKTEDPQQVWGVEEYAEFVYQFAEQLGISKFVLAGHSFGGQTAIQFAVEYPEKLDKLVLIAAAALRHEPSTKAKLLVAVASVAPEPIKKMAAAAFRRSDYGKAQGIMKDIMRKVIKQDLTTEVGKITVPTLIIWGDRDDVTPTKDAYAMNELIPNSKLEIIEGGKHALNFQMPDKLANTICSLLS